MLNVILIFVLLLNFAVGFYFIMNLKGSPGGKLRSIFRRKTANPNPPSLEWDHMQMYLLDTSNERYDAAGE